MTYAQGQATPANRSRILGSIFARTPRDTSDFSDHRPDPRRQPSRASSRNNTHARPSNWRDVTTRQVRETLAERICARFFSRGAAAAAVSQEREFVTAGQRLQALSGAEDVAPAGQQNLAAILDATAQNARAAAAQDENGKAQRHAALTAKAA